MKGLGRGPCQVRKHRRPTESTPSPGRSKPRPASGPNGEAFHSILPSMEICNGKSAATRIESENGRPRGPPLTKSMGFQIRLSQQRLGIRAGWPRPETICGSQRTRVDSGGFVSTGVSTKLRNPSKTEEKWSGAGEGNRTLVSGLGSPHSTIEPHPRRETELVENNRRGARTQRWSWTTIDRRILGQCSFDG